MKSGIKTNEKDSNMKILVTGGGGFIGGRIVELAARDGLHVLAGIHSNRGLPRLARIGANVIHCDIMSPESLDQAIAGVDAVVHCAMADGPSIVQGTTNVLDSATRHQVQKVVLISTIDVYGEQEGDLDEDSPIQKSGYWYNEAKIEAEQIAQKYSNEFDLTILRPAIVYGPFCKPWVMRYFERLQHGRLDLLSTEKNGFCNAVYVDDVAGAVLAALSNPAHRGGTYNVVGPDALTWNEYFLSFAKLIGNQELQRSGHATVSRSEPIPIRWLRAFAKWMMKRFPSLVKYCYTQVPPLKRLMKRAEATLKLNPDARELVLYARKARYRSNSIENEIGFSPVISLADGLARTGNYLDVYFR